MISLPKILILAIVQGATELLPVSSSAHVIVAEKLMGLDPTKPGNDASFGHASYRHHVGGHCFFLEFMESEFLYVTASLLGIGKINYSRQR